MFLYMHACIITSVIKSLWLLLQCLLPNSIQLQSFRYNASDFKTIYKLRVHMDGFCESLSFVFVNVTIGQWFSSRSDFALLSPQGHLMQTYLMNDQKVLLASRGQKKGILLNVLKCIDSNPHPQRRIIQQKCQQCHG